MVEFPWEDNLLERKLQSDLKDLLKTLVAFANSVKPGHVATILIGEKDDGTVQGVTDPDNIQKQVRQECDKIYPPILWRSTVYENNSKFCIRVEIENNGETPHFGGAAWVRQGSETKSATDEVFQRLIDLRLSIMNELAKWLKKEVTVHGDTSTMPASRREEGMYGSTVRIFNHRWEWEEVTKIVFLNSHWVTFEKPKTGERCSEPLSKLTLSYDDKNNRLRVIVAY